MRPTEIWMIVGFMLLVEVSELLGIKCYTCKNVYSNYMCITDNDIEQCDKPFHTCQTTVRYSLVSEKMTISKSCSTNTSCENQANATRYLYPCGSSGSWICTTCCYDDLCNLDSSSHLLASLVLSAACLLIGLHGAWPG